MKTMRQNTLCNRPVRPSLSQLAAILLSVTLAAAEPHSATPPAHSLPQPGRKFVFPRDHGSHPGFDIEWWYVTGHLLSPTQTPFGFQATFFRRSLDLPDSGRSTASPAFGNSQLYLAHMALVDIKTGDFLYQERLNRDGWDAGSATNTLDVHNGNWSLRLVPPQDGPGAGERFLLRGTVGADQSFALTLQPQKALVVFGTNGVSRKAADPTAASHYLTYSRLAVSGNLTRQGATQTVSGQAWMDHEFSSSQLGAGQVGWDWLCLQFFEGRELMAYRLRRSDGSTDPFATVAWIDTDCRVRQTGPDQFRWTVLEHWISPKTRTKYPALIRLDAVNPDNGRTNCFLIQPLVADQELAARVGGVSYWEGACRVLDEHKKEIGRAYLELTGYGESLKGKF